MVEADPLYDEKIIVIYTTTDTSDEFNKFKERIDYENHPSLFRFDKANPIELCFCRSDPTAPIKPVTLASLLACICIPLEAHEDQLCVSRINAVNHWTLGLLVHDARTRQFYAATSGHPVLNQKIRDPKAFVSEYVNRKNSRSCDCKRRCRPIWAAMLKS